MHSTTGDLTSATDIVTSLQSCLNLVCVTLEICNIIPAVYSESPQRYIQT